MMMNTRSKKSLIRYQYIALVTIVNLCLFSFLNRQWCNLQPKPATTHPIAAPRPRGIVLDVLCPGCRLVKTKTRVTCGELINEIMMSRTGHNNTSSSSNSLLVVDAARQVARNYPECQRCDPSSCQEADKYYWRVDEPFSGNSLYQARTPMLRIPEEYRFPYLTADNISEHIDRLVSNSSSATGEELRLLWDFNPSIAILPKDQIPHHSKLSRNQTYYIMAVRVSTNPMCYLRHDFWHSRIKPKLKWQNLLGLAILDKNLNIVLETVVSHENKEDHRIFNLNGQLFLGVQDYFTAIWINPPPDATNLDLLDPAFPHMNHPAANGFPAYLQKPTLCCASRHCRGKNFNYFVDDQGTVLVETFQSSPRIVEVADTTSWCNRNGIEERPIWDAEADKRFIDKYRNLSHTHDDEHPTVFLTEDLPRESFGTIDELHFAEHNVFEPPYTEERGTACCVRVNDPRHPGKELFVGVSHSKTNKIGFEMKRKIPELDFAVFQYTSRLYAFETLPPYRLVARSGQFCLGSPQDEEERKGFINRFWVDQVPYRLNHTNYSCPGVTFIMALSESVEDPSQVIIGYGLYDCGMRIAKVQKDHLVQLLFMDQQESAVP